MERNCLTYLTTPSDGTPIPDLIRHALWVWGKDPEAVHSLILLNNLALELALDGKRSYMVSNQTLKTAREFHPYSITLNNIPDDVRDIIIARFISEKVETVHLVDAVRTLLGLPVYNHTCHTLVAYALELDVPCPTMPEDIVRALFRQHLPQVTMVGQAWVEMYKEEYECQSKKYLAQTAALETT